MHVALPKRPINQFKPVQLSKQQERGLLPQYIYCGLGPYSLAFLYCPQLLSYQLIRSKVGQAASEQRTFELVAAHSDPKRKSVHT